MFAEIEKLRNQLSEKHDPKLEGKINQSYFNIQRITGEEAELNEERRRLGRWKEDMEKKSDRQNRRLSEVMSDELALIKKEKGEEIEETENPDRPKRPEGIKEGDPEWINWKKAQKAWFEHMNGIIRFEVRDEYKRQKNKDEINEEVLINRVWDGLWDESEDYLEAAEVKRLFPDYLMKDMLRKKIERWILDSIGKTKSEVTQSARSDDRAKRAKLMKLEGYRTKEIADTLNLDTSTIRGYFRHKMDISA